jgi:hypothetical protein
MDRIDVILIICGFNLGVLIAVHWIIPFLVR